MKSKLNAAEPTMVAGPRSPAWNVLATISTTARRISGAEDPRAMRVRLATVEFQTSTSTETGWPDSGVMTSIDDMKTSAEIATPKNR